MYVARDTYDERNYSSSVSLGSPSFGTSNIFGVFFLDLSGVTLFLCAADMAGARSFSKQGLFGDFSVEVLFFPDASFCGESTSLPSSSDRSSKGITEILELGFAGVFGVCGDGVTGGASVGMSSFMHLTVIPCKNDSNSGNGKLEQCAMSTSTGPLGLVTCKIREIRSWKISMSNSTLAHFYKSIVT